MGEINFFQENDRLGVKSTASEVRSFRNGADRGSSVATPVARELLIGSDMIYSFYFLSPELARSCLYHFS